MNKKIALFLILCAFGSISFARTQRDLCRHDGGHWKSGVCEPTGPIRCDRTGGIMRNGRCQWDGPSRCWMYGGRWRGRRCLYNRAGTPSYR